MTKTFYIVKNNSSSEGIYFIDGEYHSLFSGQEVQLEKLPVNKTSNLTLKILKKEVGSGELLNLKEKIVKRG